MKKPKKPHPKTKTILVRRTNSVGILYKRSLNAIAKYIIKQTKLTLYPALKLAQKDYTGDSWADNIDRGLKTLLENFVTITFRAESISNKFIRGVDQNTSEKIKQQAIKKFGVNAFLNNPELENFLKIKIKENTNLIKSIPSVHHEKLSTLVYENVSRGPRASEIIKDIQK